jgi:ElaB/YqjD/DUF883 family membrane-anchored ribosome-binding protein
MAGRNYLITDPSTAGASAAPSEQTPERSAEEIRQDIAATRESITETVDRLTNRVQETFDWRTYVDEYPLVALGVTAGLGFFLAFLFRSRSTPGERIKDALAETVEDLTGRFSHQLDQIGPRRSGLSRTVKAAATGAITKAATDYLRNRLAERGVMRPNVDDYSASIASDEQDSKFNRRT